MIQVALTGAGQLGENSDIEDVLDQRCPIPLSFLQDLFSFIFIGGGVLDYPIHNLCPVGVSFHMDSPPVDKMKYLVK